MPASTGSPIASPSAPPARRGTVRRRLLASVIVGPALVAAAAAPARADFSPVRDVQFEPNHKEILDTVYGGNFVRDGVNFSNGTITAERVPDTVAGGGAGAPLDAFGGVTDGATDQVWTDAVITGRGRARFASFDQILGVNTGLSAGGGTPVVDVTGHAFDVGGTGGPVDLRGQDWRWTRSGFSGPFSSRQSDNAGGADQLVTYRLRGLPDDPAQTSWLLMFEDIANGGDMDYNDMVVEIKAAPAVGSPPPPAPIPLPPAVFGGGALLGAMAAYRRFRSRR